jgi:hypothetical protein
MAGICWSRENKVGWGCINFNILQYIQELFNNFKAVYPYGLTALPISLMPEPTASDLLFPDQANHKFSKTLGELKRSTFSIRNRLESIQKDAAFALKARDAFGRPLIANERCGSWYIDPEHKVGSAYFKSTDGHTSVWSFSTRRLNLHLLEVIGSNDGCIVVDSTRRGKSEYSSSIQDAVY